ncbi:molybdopterin-synthase adenylyltransferase MoeB [Demetria terragena]|uniref:molybdopterin-synthase adenylyltransferase MoeB n=1 Tax=Demetria terragena TaxID=63959 RepID=UPI001FDEFD43|nr:molybdopterin-synthase adenylyltransferase MoeB [Demetria terragena]
MTSPRYARHLLLPEVGVRGQERLREARVVVMGAGGLGAPTLSYLVAAGVGRVTIVDDDQVDLTNLQRQVLYATDDIGRSKAQTAAARLAALNPDVEVVASPTRITAETVGELVRGADVVVDGTDNFTTRYLVNDACVLAGIPLVWASILRFDAQIAVWWAGHGPCYRCVFPRPPEPGQVPSCAEGGVLGAMAGTVGAVQATEALKVVLGIGEPLVGRLLIHDALRQAWDEMPVRRDPECAVCGDHPTITSPQEVEQPSVVPADDVPTVEPIDLASELARGAVTVVDVRGADERAIAEIAGAEAVELERFRDGTAAEVLPAGSIVLVCKSGGRSAEAARLLRAATGREARSLAGGVTAWARDVDPTMPTY